MKKRLLIPLLGALLVASAPGASAHTPDAYDCRILNARQDDVTGQGVFTGMAVGYAIAADGSVGTIRCDVRINGVVSDSTPTGTGQGVFATAGEITYTATETDVVEMCAYIEWGDGHTFYGCSETILITVFPQEAADALQGAVDTANAQAGCVTVVNTGDCRSGVCLVNTGICEGGFCVVNLNYCGRGCVAVVNTGECGDRPNGWVDP